MTSVTLTERPRKTLRDLLRPEMEKQKMNFNQLAVKANIDTAIVTRFMRGVRGCSFESAIKMIRALNVPMERLNEVDV